MDDTLRDTKNILCYRYVTVLILVLMDDTLRDKDILDKFNSQKS